MKSKLTVEGEAIQDVGYRLFLMGGAGALQGFEAHNRGRTVEVLVQGGADSVMGFERFVRGETLPGGNVSKVTMGVYRGHVTPLREFREQFNSEQLAKIAVTGVETGGDIKEMKGDIKEVKGDVKEIKGDIKEMKGDVKEIKGDVKEMKGDVKEMKGDVKEIKGDIKEMKGDVKEIKGDAKGIMGKQDETTLGVRAVRDDLRSWIEPRLSRLEGDVGLIRQRTRMG